MVAPLAVEFGVEAILNEGVLMEGGDQIDRTTEPAVPSARAAAGDKFFAAEGQAAIAAVARFHTDVDFVDEQLGLVRLDRSDA